ncbi:MAG TPA: hypothetical protein PK035_12285 [Chitinophagales bacterium]|nr:hypothetical protein [Chitinophagales bacterium]
MKLFSIGILLLFCNALYASKIDSIKMNFDFRTRLEVDHGNMTLIPKGVKAKNTCRQQSSYWN